MNVVLACVCCHVLVARVVASPWWVPDLTLVGLLLGVMRRPDRWLECAVLAGLTVPVWMVRFVEPQLGAFLAFAWITQRLVHRWDVTDVRVLGLLGVLASAITTGGALWFEGIWSWPIAGLAFVRIGLTGLAVPLLDRLRGHRARVWAAGSG